MKRFAWMLLVFCMAAPAAWSASKKITAQELKDMLTQMQQQKKSDDDVAIALKQVEMSEQLTAATLNSLNSLLPGQQSLAQVYVLEARSAMLPPPASDIPTDPAPDAAAQKAILDKAADYVTKTYDALPDITATRTTIRFQDNMEQIAQASGMHSGAQDATTSFNLGATAQFFRYINSTDSAVESSKGVEKFTMPKDKGPWGPNGMSLPEEPGQSLASIYSEAQAAGKISFLRWEMVNGKKTAVFSYSVEKKKTHYGVNYCCYPDTDQTGVATFSSASIGSLNGGGGGGAKGNMQTNTSFKPWKSNVGYHGQLFINPDTGIIVRVIADADLKSSDVVHQEDTRIDYDPVTMGSQTLVVPVKSFVNTEDVPKGEDSAGKFTLRHTLYYSEFKNYQLAGAAH